MDFSLNDDQKAFVESARAFAEGLNQTAAPLGTATHLSVKPPQ